MNIKKILIVFGTRPEAIKMAPLIKEFQKYPQQFDTVVAVTGQHREMLDQVLQLFDIVPQYDMNIMRKGQDLFDVTSRVLIGMRDVLKEVEPDVVFVHGDTTTSTAAAIAAYYKKIPVAHIEAGLRTNNIYSPWPEEINRQLTSRIADYHFAPTQISKKNLIMEHIPDEKIWITGNTVIDALNLVINKITRIEDIEQELQDILRISGLNEKIFNQWNLLNDVPKQYTRKLVLITGHRRENFGVGFIEICNAINDLSTIYENVDFVYPMHLNPNVREPINEIFGNGNKKENVFFIEPLDYLPFVYLMNRSYLVLTDSGGIQEEAPGLGKPVLVMRETTERPEALEAGTVRLVGTERSLIIQEVAKLLDDNEYYKKMSAANNPYGDGHACERIVSIIKNTIDNV